MPVGLQIWVHASSIIASVKRGWMDIGEVPTTYRINESDALGSHNNIGAILHGAKSLGVDFPRRYTSTMWQVGT